MNLYFYVCLTKHRAVFLQLRTTDLFPCALLSPPPPPRSVPRLPPTDLGSALAVSTDVLERLLERLFTLQLVSEPSLRRWRETAEVAAPLRFLQQP